MSWLSQIAWDHKAMYTWYISGIYCQLSSDQNPGYGYFLYIGDEILPSYISIIS